MGGLSGRHWAHASVSVVTYDQRSIPSVLESWADTGEPHAGVIFVNRRAIAQQDFHAIAKALAAL